MPMPLYPVSVIAKFCCLTERRVQQLAKDGVIPKAEKGKYDLFKCVTGYIKYLQDRAFGKDISPIDSHAERARLIKAQADKTELEVQVLNKKLIPTDEVELIWSGLVAAFRARMLSLPSKGARKIAPLGGDFKAIEEVLQDHVFDALTELANYDPNKGKPDSDNSNNADTESGKAGDATAEADNEPMGGQVQKAK